MRDVRQGMSRVVVLVAITAATGCAKQATMTAPRREKPQPVNIQVQLTSAGLFVFPNSTPLGEGRDFPVWILTGAPQGSCLEIRFKKADPLEPDPPNAVKDEVGPCKTVIRRGVPKKGTSGPNGREFYPYAVTVTVPNGPPSILDPDIEVDR